MADTTGNEGRKALLDYLAERGLTITRFAADHGIDRVHLQRILKGDLGKRLSVDFAFAIHKATRGRVRWDCWVSDGVKALFAA